MRTRTLLTGAGLVAAGAIIAGAQTWTPPRTWTTGETLTAEQLNVHLRDNLLALRDQAGNSDVTAARIRTATGTAAMAENTDFTVHALAFYPVARSTGSTNRGCNLAPSESDDHNARVNCDGSATVAVEWTYVTASDRPSVWAAVDAEGRPTAVWAAEDPPLTTPPIAGGIEVGPPGAGVLAMLYQAAAGTGIVALGEHRTYSQNRGWTSPDQGGNIVDYLAATPARYRPAARLWAVRHLAAAQGRRETDVYRYSLRVADGAWVLP